MLNLLRRLLNWSLIILFPVIVSSQGLPPGWEYTFTATFHVVAVPTSAEPTINGDPIEPGDYLGVFFNRNDSLICGGAAEWLGDQNIAVVAFGDDFLTTLKDGFMAGETINWKIYSWMMQMEFEAAATYDSSMFNYDGKFYPNGLSALTSLVASGAPLSAIASANPSEICFGNSSQLTVTAMGGSGNYTFSWISLPEGFYSNEQNPQVTPAVTTAYIVTVDDGDNIVTDTTEVSVIPQPEALAGNDTTICEDNILMLSGQAGYYSNILWTTNGDGYFENPQSLSTLYYPGENDIITGTTRLKLHAFPLSPCTDTATDNKYVHYAMLPLVNAGSDDTICAGQDFVTLGFVNNANSILWSTSGDGSFDDPSSTLAVYTPGPGDITAGSVILTLTASPVAPCSTDIDDNINLIIEPVPVVDAGADQYIPYGTSTILDGTVTGGSGFYDYNWSPPDLLTDPLIEDPQTVSLEMTTVFILEATDQMTMGCRDDDEVTVFITGGPLSVSARAYPASICAGSVTHLEAIPTGGSGSYTYSWTSNPPGFSSTLQNPAAWPEETTWYIVEASDGFNTSKDSVQVVVYPIPVSYAGEDVTIPYGTSAVLTGSASGGSGTYSFRWSPAAFLLDPFSQSTPTINLHFTVGFQLKVTDLLSGCQDIDSVTVFVTGGPLNVMVIANPPVICKGEASHLEANASGGSGDYTYLWASDPPGFTSTLPDPVVYPDVTTEYFVQVSDGYNSTSGNVTVTVHPQPEVEIIIFPDDTVCLNETIILDATTPGATSYLWLPDGQTTPVITADSTGVGAGSKVITVIVTNVYNCQASESVHITFEYCISVPEPENKEIVRIYPNPADEFIFILLSGDQKPELELYTITGQLIMKNDHLREAGSVFKLQTGNLSPGIYLLRILTKDGYWCKRVVIR